MKIAIVGANTVGLALATRAAEQASKVGVEVEPLEVTPVKRMEYILGSYSEPKLILEPLVGFIRSEPKML